MCLYPKLVRNPKYRVNKSNGGNVPILDDIRKSQVPVGCGKCIECKKQKASNWAIRLIEDIRINRSVFFVTLTFSNESLIELKKDVLKKGNAEGYTLDNEIAKLGVKRFRERWRKKYKKSIRHWLVTELGGNRSERIHLHGFLWTDSKEEITNKWSYGHVHYGKYVVEKTVKYCVKYLHKNDVKHENYNSIVLTSAGIGKEYLTKQRIEEHRRNKRDYYLSSSGHKLKLPIYYRNKIFDEEEREDLWIENIEKNERYVLGRKVDISEGEDEYYKLLKNAQQLNKKLGYGSDERDWEKIKYENERRMLKYKSYETK